VDREFVSVHNAVSVEPADPGAVERLVRYVMRSPVSQQRLDRRFPTRRDT
jgi:hypothetical protein